MNALAFAWRSLVRQPARAALGILGVAAVGALLFDMLLLSQGLVISMRGLLERTGFDLRVTATDSLPGQGPLISDAIARANAIAHLPSVRSVIALRFARAVVLHQKTCLVGADDRPHPDQLDEALPQRLGYLAGSVQEVVHRRAGVGKPRRWKSFSRR